MARRRKPSPPAEPAPASSTSHRSTPALIDSVFSVHDRSYFDVAGFLRQLGIDG